MLELLVDSVMSALRICSQCSAHTLKLRILALRGFSLKCRMQNCSGGGMAALVCDVAHDVILLVWESLLDILSIEFAWVRF